MTRPGCAHLTALVPALQDAIKMGMIYTNVSAAHWASLHSCSRVLDKALSGRPCLTKLRREGAAWASEQDA